jgi:hypothetical protein
VEHYPCRFYAVGLGYREKAKKIGERKSKKGQCVTIV